VYELFCTLCSYKDFYVNKITFAIFLINVNYDNVGDVIIKH
jgi:hypothetical protein